MPPTVERVLTQFSDLGRFGWSAFAARNVRLDGRASVDRQTDYLNVIGVPFDQPNWASKHHEYHLLEVRAVKSPVRTFYSVRSAASRPAPFRGLRRPDDVRCSLAPEMKLVHVVSAYGIASTMTGVTGDDVIDALRDGDDAYLDMALDSWWRGGSRTIFAAPADDLKLEIAAARTASPGWADDLRDRLGLVHLAPDAGPIPVVLLMYRVDEVPRVEGLRSKRPLVTPTALESDLNPAFCPLGTADEEGRCVDLEGQLDPVREVIHPAVLLNSVNVVAWGEVAKPLPPLPYARAIHIEWVRSDPGPSDFAATTDGDLVT